jgi:hypothetical protein
VVDFHIWDVDENESLYTSAVRADSDVEGEFGAGLYAVWTENDKGVLSYMYLAFKEPTAARILINSGGRISGGRILRGSI